MDRETLEELAKMLSNRKPVESGFLVDFCDGYNAAIRHVVREIEIMIQAKASVDAMLVPVDVPIKPTLPNQDPPKPVVDAMVQPPLQKGELPDGWIFLEVGEFLKTGDVLNSTGMAVDIDRDDVRCTAPRTWRRKK